MRRLMVPVLLIAVSGCSFALSGPDPLRATHVAPRCDTGKSLVTADWVLAGVATVVALSAVGEGQEEMAAVAALSGAAFIGSAVRGNRVVNSCREEFAAYSAPGPDLDDVARRPRPPVAPRDPRSFEDPNAAPADLPAARIVTPPPVPASAPPLAPAAKAPAPPPPPAPPADEWSEFWTEVP